LIVAEAIFEFEAAKVDVGLNVGAQALDREVLHVTQYYTGHVCFRCLAAKRHGSVDPEGDLGRTQVCYISAETRRDFNDHSQLSPPHALLQLGCRADRGPFGEIMRSREAFQQPAAFRRPVLVEGREVEILDVEGDAVAEREHQDDRTYERE